MLWPRCRRETQIFKNIAEKCNELFALDFPAEEWVDSHAQFVLCIRQVAETINLR